ncbi:plastocyanin/azurin family copper-binding protein [Halovivax sp.]|uniref:cupredoxin domain-containing protein n=1 Tax=Halovivax sp. TaxID=1935978 RepID=UPI0025BB9819|nr:plastocyanin/azurin family copper-binding protein [Halovivax sp.]
MSRNDGSGDDTSARDRSTDRRAALGRRSLLGALGFGTALATGGVAAADHDDPHPPHADRIYGYSTPFAEDVPQRLAPDHEVELRTELPTGLEDGANADGDVHPPLFYFDPTGLQVAPGDVVQFTFRSPDHTVTAYHHELGFQDRVPDCRPPISSPILNEGAAWLFEFDTAGLYDFYCGPHHLFGMVMRIVVGELTEADVPDYEDTFEADPPLLPPFSAEALEDQLNGLSERNEDCEWPWLTPVEVLDAAALDSGPIQADGTVPFEAVREELGY